MLGKRVLHFYQDELMLEDREASSVLTDFVASCTVLLEDSTVSSASDKSLLGSVLGDMNKFGTLSSFLSLRVLALVSRHH